MTGALRSHRAVTLHARLAGGAILGYRATMYPVYRILRLTGQHSVCKLHPSCSHYGEEAVRVHGLGKALVLTSARLRRCGRTDRIDDPVPVAPCSPSRAEWVAAGWTLGMVSVAMVAGVRVGRRIGNRLH